jgi:hypothetical protein
MKHPFACLAALLLAMLVGARPVPAADATVALGDGPAGPAVPADFMGLSFEPPTIATPQFSPTNEVLLRLIRNLGGGVLRFGGNHVEETFWSRRDGETFPKAKAVLRPADLDRLFAFSRQAGWPVILGLNLGASVPEMAADEAAYALEAGREQLIAFEIGNEPELYRKNGTRQPDYAYDDYRRELDLYRKALHARMPRVPLCGPAHASNFGWLTNFLNDAKPDVVLASRHHYPMSADPSFTPTNARYASIENLLKAETMRESAKLVRGHQEAAARAGIPLRIGETSTASRGGKSGVSDTLASALWAVDYLFTVAELGVAGVNFHSYFRCGGYTPICADNRGGYQAMPMYYGLLLFRAAGPGHPLPVRLATPANLAAHALRGADGRIRLVLVNKEREEAATVQVTDVRKATRATVLRLRGPAPESTTGITLGGRAVAADGSWAPDAAEAVAIAEGRCEVSLPAASAAVLEFE